jgi:amino acid transporter
MVVVALCYGELAARSPTAGGEFLYTSQTFGAFPGFLVGWFLAFNQIAVCAFEGIALAWLIRVLIPGVAMGTAYTVAGEAVSWDALIIGLGSALVIAALHLRGASSAIRFQNIVTYSFIGISLLLIVCGFALGTIGNLTPLFSAMAGHSPLLGALWVFATTAYFFNGWQASMHAIEERRDDVTLRKAVWCMVGGIVAAGIFYASIILAASMAMPWESLMTRELPAAAAFASHGGGILGTVVLIAAIISLYKTWSACLWIATRLLFAQSRHGMLPRSFGAIDVTSRAPRVAILFVTALSMVGIALGRSAILPIVDTLAICAALSFILCLLVLLRRRRADPNPPTFTVPGGMVTIVVAMIGVTFMVSSALIQPVLARGGVPVEWLMLIAWGGVGALIWVATRSLRRGKSDESIVAADLPPGL